MSYKSHKYISRYKDKKIQQYKQNLTNLNYVYEYVSITNVWKQPHLKTTLIKQNTWENLRMFMKINNSAFQQNNVIYGIISCLKKILPVLPLVKTENQLIFQLFLLWKFLNLKFINNTLTDCSCIRNCKGWFFSLL